MKNDWQTLVQWAENLGFHLSSEQLKQFQIYHHLLLEWNKKINLVSRQDQPRIISYHFIDSICSITEINKNSVVCDLGSGAGLPGIPIAIVRNDNKMYLIESIKKKTLFLSEAVKSLNLENTIVLNQRAETIQDKMFDIILVRLLGKIPDVLPIASKLLSSKGKIIFYKIAGVEKEIISSEKIVKKTNFKLQSVKDITLPVTGILRKLVVYERTC